MQERQHKWVSKLQAYEFEIKYVKGKHNIVADALSWRPAVLSLMDVAHDWNAQLLVEYSKDKHAYEVLDDTHGDDRFRVMDDVIYYKDKIYLVSGYQVREKVMHVANDYPLVGHLGFLKTYHTIREHFSWCGLKGDELRHIQECITCHRNKLELSHLTRLL